MNVPTTPPNSALMPRERGLPVLTERELFVRLKLLKPRAESELVPAVRELHLVLVGENVAEHVQVGSVVAAGQPQLRRRVGGRAATDDDRANRKIADETRNIRASSRRARSGFTEEEIGRAGEAEARRVQQSRRKNVRFVETQHLFAQVGDVGAERIDHGVRSRRDRRQSYS